MLPAPTGPPVLAEPQEFDSLGGLYRGLEQGLIGLVDRYGEAAVFVGSRRTQSAATLFAFNFIGDGLRDALDPKDR